MSIFGASLLTMAGLALAVVGLVAFLGVIALRRCERKDIPAVLEALGTLVDVFGRAPVARGSWFPNPSQVAPSSVGSLDGRGEVAIDGTAPVNRIVEH